MKPCAHCGDLFQANGGSRYCSACKGSSREKRAVVAAQKSNPCADCGRCWPPYCMQFDHLPGCVKVDTVSRLMSGAAPLCVLLAEMSKCDVVCMNCHAIRTRSRGLFVASSVPMAGPSEWVGKGRANRLKGVVGWDGSGVEPLVRRGRHWPAASKPEPVPIVPVRKGVPPVQEYVSLEERRKRAKATGVLDAGFLAQRVAKRSPPKDPLFEELCAELRGNGTA